MDRCRTGTKIPGCCGEVAAMKIAVIGSRKAILIKECIFDFHTFIFFKLNMFKVLL